MLSDDKPIVNKVAASSLLLTVDLEDYLPPIPRVPFDIKPYLFQELILREKDFRENLKQIQWSDYQGKAVYIFCSVDATIPYWAYLLIAAYLRPVTPYFTFGTERDLISKLVIDNLQKIDIEQFKDKKVLLKGCSDNGIGEEVYVEAARIMLPYVSSLMYGEACSNVPIVKLGKVS